MDFLYEALRAEHAACRHFYTRHDERLLGHVVFADPLFLGQRVRVSALATPTGFRAFIGAVNLVQWLRIQAYHDAHHYDRGRIRIKDPEYGRAPTAPGEVKG